MSAGGEGFGSYIIAAEAGLEVPLSAKLKLRLAARDTCDSRPDAGRDSNDLTLLTDLSYAFADAAPIKCKVCRWEAANKPVPKPEQNVWPTTGSIGCTMITGNADAALLTLGLDTVKYADADEIRVGALAAYGEADGARNNQMAWAKAQYNRVLKAPFYAALSTDFLHDEWVDFLAIFAFVRLHLRAGRLWLGWIAVSARTVSLGLNFTVGLNLNYLSVTGLRQVRFLGGDVSLPMGTPNHSMLVGQTGLLFLLLFVSFARGFPRRPRRHPHELPRHEIRRG